MSSMTNVFVGNLSKTVDDALLKAMFETFGTVISHKVIVDNATRVSRGFGFVQFENPAAAVNAVNAMNNYPMEGQALLVKLADRDAGAKSSIPGNQSSASSVPPSDNVFVGGIPSTWTEKELNQLFGTYGTIVSSIVLKDKTTGAPKNAGMVRFADVFAASVAVQQLNGWVLEGTTRALEVKFASAKEDKAKSGGFPSENFPYGQAGRGKLDNNLLAALQAQVAQHFLPNPQAGTNPLLSSQNSSVVIPKSTFTPEENTNLHIWGLDSAITDLHLYEAFAPYGAVNSVKVIVDPTTGQSKGYGFVQFLRAADAANALAKLNGLSVGNRQWSVTYHKKKP